MTETILAPIQNQQLSIKDASMIHGYKLDECVRLSLLVPKINYPFGSLPREVTNMLANVSPKIPGIVSGMSFQLAHEILESTLEDAVAELKANTDI